MIINQVLNQNYHKNFKDLKYELIIPSKINHSINFGLNFIFFINYYCYFYSNSLVLFSFILSIVTYKHYLSLFNSLFLDGLIYATNANLGLLCLTYK